MTATGTARNGFPPDASSAAKLYLERGLSPIPLPARSKNPGYSGWQQLRLTAGNVDDQFPVSQPLNIGILNGAPSENLADVDLDAPEARLVAPFLLPGTGWIFGRPSALRSHWIYRTDIALDRAQVAFEDVDGSVLLELRGNGGQTVFPPSLHQGTGELIGWDRFEERGHVTLADLQRAVGKAAAATILARHWPKKGARDKAALALHGALAHAGWSEEDIANFVKAVVTAAGDDEVRMRAGKAESTVAKLKNGDKVTGFTTLANLVGENVIGKVREWLLLTVPATVADIRLPSKPPWPDPLPPEAYHGIVGEIVRVLEPGTEADPAALLFQVLVGVGNIVGREGYFQVEADRHHANESVVLVGKTAKGRKGTSFGHVRYLLNQVEELWVKDCVQSGLSTGEGLIWAVRDPIMKMEKIKEKGAVHYEEVVADPGVQDKRLLVYEPEYANVLKQLERQGNTLSVILRQAWDGSDLRALTKNSPARASGAHVSLIGHITADELRRLLTTTEVANGFGNRNLWVAVQRSKLLPEGGHTDRGTLDQLAARLADTLAKTKGRGRIYRDEDARALWHEIYADLSEARPGMAGALMARSEAHVTRLSLVYALLDGADKIGVPHLMAAVALWNYVEQTIHHVFGDALGDHVADELLQILRNCPQGLTRTEIRDFFGRHLSSDRIGRALGILIEHKLVCFETEQTGGRPLERWFAGPMVPPKRR